MSWFTRLLEQEHLHLLRGVAGMFPEASLAVELSTVHLTGVDHVGAVDQFGVAEQLGAERSPGLSRPARISSYPVRA